MKLHQLFLFLGFVLCGISLIVLNDQFEASRNVVISDYWSFGFKPALWAIPSFICLALAMKYDDTLL